MRGLCTVRRAKASRGPKHLHHFVRQRNGPPDPVWRALRGFVTAAGAGLFPFVTEESLVGFLEQSSWFLKPVDVGDTLYAALEVDELTPNGSTGVVGLRSTVHSQRGELVLDGRQGYLLRRCHKPLPPSARVVETR